MTHLKQLWLILQHNTNYEIIAVIDDERQRDPASIKDWKSVKYLLIKD